MRRFDNYCSALSILETAQDQDLDNEFVQGGVIDKFFLQFELGWKLFKRLLAYEGLAEAASGSPREIIKSAYSIFDFMDEELWLRMLHDRNNTAHDYNAENASDLVDVIIELYVPEFARTREGVRARYGSLLDDLD